MNISTRQLRAFVAVARLGSFTRAAQQLHITQAGLSGMMREFEAQLGSRLFDRTTRTVSLTSGGSALLPVVLQVLEQLEGAVEALGRAGEAASRTLSVATTPMLSSAVLPVVIQQFFRNHPNISVKVRDLDRSQIQAHVESGEIDAGFGVFLNTASGIDRQQLLKLPLLVAAPASVDLPDSVTWRWLREHPLLALPVDNPVQRVIDDRLHAIGRGNEERQHFNNFNTLLGMVEAGLGLAVVPAFARQTRRYEVRFGELTHPKVSLDFYQITKKGREQNPMLGEFSKTLAAVLGSKTT